MKKNEMQQIVNSLIPKLYSFAYALVPDELQAEQMIIDAYAVFLVREKNFITDFKYSRDKKEKSALKKYVMANMISDLFDLGAKRYAQLKYLGKKDFGQFDAFYRLSTAQRGILFLKEKLNYPVEGIQEILSMERYQVVEALYNAQHGLVSTEQNEQYAR